jgi:leucyl-tRNA synthetase
MAYSVEIDRKWQDYWEQSGLNHFNPERQEKKLYVLEMFSYPSGANLHVGHWYNNALSDSWARMKKMQGYEVFQPMGFDAFGLPAENYASKRASTPWTAHTATSARWKNSCVRWAACLTGMQNWQPANRNTTAGTSGCSSSSTRMAWPTGKMRRSTGCPNCNTVLANEQVDEGACERCGTEVTRKNLTQWFFRITAYAQELLDCLPTLDWPEKTKKIQTNWNGRSEGAELVFGAEPNGQATLDHDGNPVSLKVFTTRADTVMGVTYVVVAPESELGHVLTTDEHRSAVEAYIADTRKVSDIDRMSTVREKTGVFTGSYAIHPLTGAKVPIWAADYVIAGYGTGGVMAARGHDERDFEFAEKFNLPIQRVIRSADGSPTNSLL